MHFNRNAHCTQGSLLVTGKGWTNYGSSWRIVQLGDAVRSSCKWQSGFPASMSVTAGRERFV